MSAMRIEAKLDHATLEKPLLFSAFTAGDIYRVEFPPGTELYKVTQAGAVTNARALTAGASGFLP